MNKLYLDQLARNTYLAVWNCDRCCSKLNTRIPWKYTLHINPTLFVGNPCMQSFLLLFFNRNFPKKILGPLIFSRTSTGLCHFMILRYLVSSLFSRWVLPALGESAVKRESSERTTNRKILKLDRLGQVLKGVFKKEIDDEKSY